MMMTNVFTVPFSGFVAVSTNISEIVPASQPTRSRRISRIFFCIPSSCIEHNFHLVRRIAMTQEISSKKQQGELLAFSKQSHG